MVQHLPTHGAQHVLDSAHHMGMDVVQHDYVPCEHVGHFMLVVVQRMHLPMNFGWLTISSTKELNDS
jgi:hypothetical protein